MRLAKRYAPKATIFANGSLHNIEQAVAALDGGADIVTIGRGALANPDLPKRLSNRDVVNEFDPAILGPIANIKATELV
jgi:2,4-dienoyl-CoA reductase-like NADH-dependent reductase (Old Yellow Enzyme family)